MGQVNDREHFEDYREQTHVKHEILAAYLPAYFHILKKWNQNLLFIDGFAGRGTYTRADTGEVVHGSPLRALRLIAEIKGLADKVSTIFIESDEALFQQLEQAVNDFYREHPHIRKPECICGTFATSVADIVREIKGDPAPTFLFVDPCGVSGANFEAISEVLKFNGSEAFIFFNIDGVRRVAGLEPLSNVLVELMGSAARAQKLYDGLRGTEDVTKREMLILKQYLDALKEDAGVRYRIPFRIEHEGRRTTSHYLIHATKHPRGFAIMKDVMWRRGRAEDQAGGLEFTQASRTNIYPLFDTRGDSIKADILKALEKRPLRVGVFCEEWVSREDDMLSEPAYKTALLELEATGDIEALSKNDGNTVTQASARRKYKGKPTLGNDYYVRVKRRDLH